MTEQDVSLIQRIDERTQRIDDKIDQALTAIGTLQKEVFIGNGHPSLQMRMTASEGEIRALQDRFDAFLTQCERCQAVVFKPPEDSKLAEMIVKEKEETKRAEIEVDKIEANTKQVAMTKRWEFWTAIFSGTGLLAVLLHIVATASTAAH